MSSQLFSPLTLRSVSFDNRIVVSPMCQYSAIDGCMTDWHLMHLGQFAISGVGLMFTEATGVTLEGRISPGCPALCNDDTEHAIARVVAFCKQYGNTKLGIQLAHAGRKASTKAPWLGRDPVMPADGGWEPVAPSAVAFADDQLVPRALDEAGMAALKQDFVDSLRRADRIGFDVAEVHMAHGYLMHQFLSPLSNRRNDGYGGTRENRMRYPLEVFEALRHAWPTDKPLGVRISATDWIDGGWDVDDSVALAAALKEVGCDFIDVSSGGLSPEQKITVGPGYQVPFAERVRKEALIPVMAVGMITVPAQAEEIVASGQADMVALARGMLYDPRWAWHAAEELGGRAAYPNQYARSHPTLRGDPHAKSNEQLKAS